MRERESLFNEYLIEVRKREKEEKSQRREQVRIFYNVLMYCSHNGTRDINNYINQMLKSFCLYHLLH